MDVNNWIEEVHRIKHNMIPVVKMAVSKPMDALLKPSCLTDDVPASLLPMAEQMKGKADKIMTYLSAMGNISAGQEELAAQLEEQIQSVIEIIIPQIRNFESFYLLFKDKDFYFSNTEEGKRAFELVMKAPIRCSMSCQGLQQLNTIHQDVGSDKSQSIPLIDVVEEVFDDLENVNVIYHCSNRNIKVNLDKSDFETSLLFILAENIRRHAFPYVEYKDKLVIDKIVEIEIWEETDRVLLRVSNNGNMFCGDTDKLFTVGYHAGKYGQTGFGLASAKSYLTKIGGDIQFVPNKKYAVSFLITIPKK